ncbi:MAG: hypothetical protein R2861_14905 [Desulfobacterales bacterium]
MFSTWWTPALSLPASLPRHPYQDVLMQALGAADLADVNVEKITHEFHKNEQILLCSDGLTKELTDKDIAAHLALEEIEEQEKVDRLIESALEKRGPGQRHRCFNFRGSGCAGKNDPNRHRAH